MLRATHFQSAGWRGVLGPIMQRRCCSGPLRQVHHQRGSPTVPLPAMRNPKRRGPGHQVHCFRASRAQPLAAEGASTHPERPCVPSAGSSGRHHAERGAPYDPYKSQRKHNDLFDAEKGWKRDWMAPELLDAMEQARQGDAAAIQGLVTLESEGVFSFPMLSPELCSMLLEEVDNYFATGLPVRRPNSMNNYGIIVNEIGLRPMMTRLQQDYLWPIAREFFPEHASQFDFHHSFMVKYKQGEDLGLDMHTDDSDVTFNVCLGREFKGAGLTFCGMSGSPEHRRMQFRYQHVLGRCLMHLGSHRHGADDILEGERNNLIIWNHNDVYRASDAYKRRRYQREAGPPDPECLSYTHDRDYGQYKRYPEGKEHFRTKSWCPPPHLCYDGMKPEGRMP